MALINFGLVAAAGSGKTTCANHLVAAHGYRAHALAVPLKVTVAFNIARQFRMEILGKPYYRWYAHVDRIIHGEMGVVRQICDQRDQFQPTAFRSGEQTLVVPSGDGTADWVDSARYTEDVAVRDALLALERQYKPFLRGEEQQYGTEVIRKIAEELRPGTWLTPAEEWTTILAREFRRDNEAGIAAVCDDCRHTHEAATITGALDLPGLLVRIERTERAAIGMTAERAQHSSEQYWMQIPTHYRLVNDGPIAAIAPALDALLAHAADHPTAAPSLDWPIPLYACAGTTLAASR